ncbi:MAG: phosphoesterase PA-phosphatase related protein [Acidimicrobiaceae bacterium]|nr:phosphoesterase PA-phosphatase related protein [Acidimicrobiaceae bacterium]
MDTTLFLDINRFARRTAWAHGFMHLYALYLGLAVLAVLAVLAFWRARSGWLDVSASRIAATLWVPIGALVAFGLNQPLSQAVGRLRPYYALSHVLVLIPKVQDSSLPSDHATVAGAVIAGLWLSRERAIATVATVLGLFLAFARVYVGAHYPGDVAAGLAFGAIVSVAGYLLARPWIEALVAAISRGPLSALVGGRSAKPLETQGPAAAPTVLAATGAVRVIESAHLAPRRPGAPDDDHGEKVSSS